MSEQDKIPGAVLVDGHDGFTWAQDEHGQPFTLETAGEMAARWNARMKPEHQRFRVFALVPAGAPSELGRMFDVAQDDELGTLEDLAGRAGLIWRCSPGSPDYCGYVNDEGAAACGGCGTPRRSCSCGVAWADEPGHDDDGHALAHKLTAQMNEPA
jgi:hypothetical protein